ncbi:MAG: hypothetical protein IJ814_02405 [Paludibacteraceae bacterium]|nr:hypothetical protein [Paludibacteraceae bacterium]
MSAQETSSLAGTPAQPENKQQSRWLDDYTKPVGLTYNAMATLNTTYIWRGLYSGALSLQASADVGYGGLYLNTWWNLGTHNWRFNSFEPEVDFSLGFNRWGLNIFLLYVHHFDCGFFDFSNRVAGGNRLELNARYTVSSKLPLSILWATRVAAADGYINAAGDTLRAWSSYVEISYTQRFAYGISLYGAVGMTPWKSCYTGFRYDFGVVNIDLRLRKDWSLSERCGLMLQGQFTINPTMLAADRTTAQWHPYSPADQTINANLSVGVYLK